MSTDTKTRPVHEFRMGRIRAAIWANETQNGTRHNVTISRIYKDGDAWKCRKDLENLMRSPASHCW